jgi:hypothetical protein
MRICLALALAVAVSVSGSAMAGGEIYGTVTTTGGKTLEGPIRWDTNENFWNDVLDARKTEVIEQTESDDGFRFSLFGWEIINSGSNRQRYHQLSIPFGYLRAVEPDGSNAAYLELKDGTRIRAEGSTSDLGRGLEIEIDDKTEGRVKLTWRRIARIEFSAGPGEGLDKQRLYGTATTDAGEFTGFIVWDRDESLLGDVLDGEDGGKEREIAFRRIASIEPVGSRAARVQLKDGEEMTLSGTNDVNDGMRGMLIAIDGVGMVEVQWDELHKVVFTEAPSSPSYDSFDSGKRLSGTVHANDGQSYSGAITWDMDETYGWEPLNGELHNVEYSVLFRNVRSIVPVGGRGAEVTMTDGRSILLTGSNDVGDGNKGVMVTAEDGSEIIFGWESVKRVEFH